MLTAAQEGEPIGESDHRESSVPAAPTPAGTARPSASRRSVLFDFGGVILSSPFESFRRYEERRGLPPDFIRQVNAENPHANAWARLERSEITADEFDTAFAEESGRLGHRIPGWDVLGCLDGEIRPAMVTALRSVNAAGHTVACLTNNVVSGPDGLPSRHDIDEVLTLFDHVIESSKVGVRKPERRFYELACEQIGATPEQCVFLDDLGINLKPAREMGMTTIKVTGVDQAIADLEAVLGIALH